MRTPARETGWRADGGRGAGATGGAHGCDSARRIATDAERHRGAAVDTGDGGGRGGSDGGESDGDDRGGGPHDAGTADGGADGGAGENTAPKARVLIAFAGDGAAESTLASELQRRGAE
eukprot:4724785-Pleurochrysis_carterae.AAC.1